MELTQKLFSTADYPCISDKLVDEEGELVARVSTKEDTDLLAGSFYSSDGIYDLVFDAKLITREMLLDELAELNETAGITFEIEFRN